MASFEAVMFTVLQRLTLTRVCVRVPPLVASCRAVSCWWWELGGQRELVSLAELCPVLPTLGCKCLHLGGPLFAKLRSPLQSERNVLGLSEE